MTEIGKEYGTALFLLACEQNKKSEYGEALKTVRKVFESEPDYLVFLASPSIPKSERLSALEEAFSKKIPAYVLFYLQLLCEKGRIDCFFESVNEYLALVDASEHISNACVTSAVELTDAEKEKLQNKLESMYHGEVRTTYCVDNSLLGGLIVEVDGKVLDGSLRHRLRQVKEVMNQ